MASLPGTSSQLLGPHVIHSQHFVLFFSFFFSLSLYIYLFNIFFLTNIFICLLAAPDLYVVSLVVA